MKPVAAVKRGHRGDRVAATEPLTNYLLDATGLDNTIPKAFMQASEEGNDAPSAAVAQTSALFKPGVGQMRALILNTQATSSATKQLCRQATSAGVPVVRVTELRPGVEPACSPAWKGGPGARHTGGHRVSRRVAPFVFPQILVVLRGLAPAKRCLIVLMRRCRSATVFAATCWGPNIRPYSRRVR